MPCLLRAFSSLRIPHYKGFSRIHINAKVGTWRLCCARARIVSQHMQAHRDIVVSHRSALDI